MPTQKQFLDNVGLTELLDELGQYLKGKQNKLTVGDGVAIDNNDTIRTTGIPFGRCDSTSTSTHFTATVPGIYKLEDGVCCMIDNGVVTSESGFTLNVNGLGAKPVYTNLAAATRDTTIFNINYTMLFVYDETRVSGGCWVCYRGYDANTNTIGYQVRSNSHSLPASQKFYRYRLLFTSADGTHYVPANTSTSTNATSSRTVNQTPIDPFGHIVYYGYTTAIEANARPGASYLWVIYTLSLGYSFNRTGAALTLTSWKPVYIKCAPQADGSAIIDADTPYVQALPTTADGKIYIFLGVAYNATSIELLNNHPVYYHDSTGIRLWTGKDSYSKSEVDAALISNKGLEYYNLDNDSNLTPIFDAIYGGTPTQSDLNTACEYLLNLVKNQGDNYGRSKKVIYLFDDTICLRQFHEGQLWDAGGSDNPYDSCEVDFELFDAYNSTSMYLRVVRDNSGNWHTYV